MDEHILFHNAGVKISNQQLIVPGHVYALKDIESVEFSELEPKRTVALVLILAGLFLLFREGNLFALGGFSVLMGIVIWITGNTQYSVIINTSSGRHEVLNSMDRAYIEKVLHAMDAAMLKHEHYRPVTGDANPLQTLDDNISVGTS
jgi:hypothetical protein